MILTLVLIAEFMVILDATIVTVALPSIQSGLGFDTQLDLQWVINAYILLFGGFLMLGGRAGELFGRRRLFVIGLALFAGASLFNGVAQSPGMLIAGRAAQGLGAALVAPSVLSIIVATFTDNSARTRALGFFSAVGASGSAAGLLFGGVMTDALSWRWIFLELRCEEAESLKREDARAYAAYGQNSSVGKILEIHHELPGRIHIVLIRQSIGF